MNKIVHYIGLDVHKETIAVSIAPQNSTEVRRYGIIGGTLDAIDKLVKKLAQENLELRLVYEAGPCGFVLCRRVVSKAAWHYRLNPKVSAVMPHFNQTSTYCPKGSPISRAISIRSRRRRPRRPECSSRRWPSWCKAAWGWRCLCPRNGRRPR